MTMNSRIDRVYSAASPASQPPQTRAPLLTPSPNGYFPRKGSRWGDTSGNGGGWRAEMEQAIFSGPLKDPAAERDQSQELLGRIRQAAELDSEMRAKQRQQSSRHMGRSRLFASSGLMEVQELTDAVRLNRVMEGARQRLEVSDEANLALLASEIVDRGLQQPTVYTALPVSPCSTAEAAAQSQPISSNSEWQLYQDAANDGVPMAANLAWGAAAVDDLRNSLAKQLHLGAKQGETVESALQQLADTETALKLQHQAQLAHVKQAAAMARQAVDLAEQQLSEQLGASFDSQLSSLRHGMTDQRASMHKLQKGCSLARRLLTAFCGSQSFRGTELEGEATHASEELQSAVSSARSLAAELPALLTLQPPQIIDSQATVRAIKAQMVFSDHIAEEPAAAISSQKVLQFKAQLIMPLSVLPLKIGAVLQALALQLRVPDVEALTVVNSEPFESCSIVEISLVSSTPLAHASALASLDVMRAEAPQDKVVWSHISVDRIWDLKQSEFRVTLPGKTIRVQLVLSSECPKEFSHDDVLVEYAAAIGVGAEKVSSAKVTGLTRADKEREAMVLRQLLESAELDQPAAAEQPVVSQQLAFTVLVKLSAEQSVLRLVSGTMLAGWTVDSSTEQAAPTAPDRPNRTRAAAAAASEEECPGAPPAWQQEIQELAIAKAEAIAAEDFARAHQLKGQIEVLRVKLPATVQLVLHGGWLGVDWHGQLASDLASAMFCEPHRISVQSLKALNEEGHEFDLLEVQLTPSNQPGDPSPDELKTTFMAQLKSKESRLYLGMLTQHVVYQATLRRLYGGGTPSDEQANMTVEAFTQLARSIFEEKDEDMSQEIDRAELSNAIRDLWSRLGTPLAVGDLEKDVEASLRKFDKDNSGTLDFAEFMGMLCEEPWIELLPAAVRGEVPKLAEQLKMVNS